MLFDVVLLYVYRFERKLQNLHVLKLTCPNGNLAVKAGDMLVTPNSKSDASFTSEPPY